MRVTLAVVGIVRSTVPWRWRCYCKCTHLCVLPNSACSWSETSFSAGNTFCVWMGSFLESAVDYCHYNEQVISYQTTILSEIPVFFLVIQWFTKVSKESCGIDPFLTPNKHWRHNAVVNVIRVFFSLLFLCCCWLCKIEFLCTFECTLLVL